MRPMSEKYIPEHVDPFRFAEQNLQLSGVVRFNDMKRLGSTLSPNQDLVNVNLEFGVDEQGVTFLKGQIETKMALQCQRCMEPFIYDIKSNFVLGIVHTLDEANALPDNYEPALVKDGQLALRELIEDELILNLPIIPKHEPEECKVKLPLKDAEWDKTNTPFQVLESLKHKQ